MTHQTPNSPKIPIRLELPTGTGFGPVNAYLFPGPEPVLVDTGLKSEPCWSALLDGLARHNLTPADLHRVVITHPHVDHCGLANRLTAHSPADIWIADLGRPWLVNLPDRLLQRVEYYRRNLLPRWHFPPDLSRPILNQLTAVARACEAVPPERIRVFHPGDRLELGGQAWQVLHAPGHAWAQTCFYQPHSRQLLSADMLLARAPAPVLDRPGDAPHDRPALAYFLDSLAQVEQLDVDRVYPGHGPPFGDHRQVIQRQRARLEQRLSECLALVRAGHTTVPALLTRMYPGPPHLAGLWMLNGYLQLLAFRGLVREQDGRFQPV